MSDHKFKVGQTVSYLSGSRGGGSRSDVFKIMQCLPPQGGDYQYRITGTRNYPMCKNAQICKAARRIFLNPRPKGDVGWLLNDLAFIRNPATSSVLSCPSRGGSQ
jgi:hypothetical protein